MMSSGDAMMSGMGLLFLMFLVVALAALVLFVLWVLMRYLRPPLDAPRQQVRRLRPAADGRVWPGNTTAACPECGAALSGDAPHGLCPRCLLQRPFSPPARRPPCAPSPTGGHGPFLAPTPEELAPHFPQLEILALLGQGGMGAVYKARQLKLDRFVAIKILPQEWGRDPAFAERFTREAKAWPGSATRTSSPSTTSARPAATSTCSWSSWTAPTCGSSSRRGRSTPDWRWR